MKNKVERKYDYLKFQCQFLATLTIGLLVIFWTMVSLEKPLFWPGLSILFLIGTLIIKYAQFAAISRKYLK